MKYDREVNEQADEENQTQEGGAKKGTSNAKNYTSRCTDLRLHIIFVALPEEEKGSLRATCFEPLLLIDLIATISALVMEIFDCRLDVLIKFVKNYVILSPPEQGEKRLGERNQIEAPTIGTAPVIGSPAVGTPAIGVPVIGSSSSIIEIGTVVVRVCSQLEEHGKMLHNHGKILERISMSIVGDSTLPLGDTLPLGQYQLSTPKKLKNASEKKVMKKKIGKGRRRSREPCKETSNKNIKRLKSRRKAMVVADVAKTDIVFFNQEEVVGKAYRASADQTTAASVEEQTLDVEKTNDEASQASADQTIVVSVEEHTIELHKLK
ncbi:hypothetical protein GIB67_013608 [Kingdonia uniflora]|uniref:Uncharacterized protein n=1 Tax=Kingdonia uniflora TaxID=39325 RepID=A0A7J7NQH3_9MAGN|nr:hypothetical protein GIB67_013608 [Kingdonia uniflora]